MTKEQLAKMLEFSTVEEMELFYDVCEGYFVDNIPSKQECLEIIKEFGLQNILIKFQSMSKDERMAYELHKLTGALKEAVKSKDYKASENIMSSIVRKTMELQEYNFKELEQSSNLSK